MDPHIWLNPHDIRGLLWKSSLNNVTCTPSIPNVDKIEYQVILKSSTDIQITKTLEPLSDFHLRTGIRYV